MFHHFNRYQIMPFFKSDKISHFQIILPRQNSYRVVAQIGRLGIVQFKQESLNHQDMPYTSQVKLCEQYLQNIKTIQRELYQQGRGLPQRYYRQQDYNVFLETYDRRYRMSNHSHLHLLEKIVGDLERAWKNRELLKQRKFYLIKEQQDLIEQRCILQITKKVFGSIERNSQFKQERFKLGIVLKKDQYSFKRTIFRMSKGLTLLETLEEESQALNKTENGQKKVAFYVYYGFFTGHTLQNKLKKLFQTYNIKEFNHNLNRERIIQRLQQVSRLLLQNKKLQQLVEQESKNIYERLLEKIPSEHQFKMSNLQYYKLYLLHQKIIYSILNAMKVQHSFTQAELYVPTLLVETLTNKLQFSLLQDKMPTPQLIPINSSKKPTLFFTNSYTDTQYQVLSAYGVPHYQEVNPAFFNSITFPFLFGVMFGDIGHGLILLGFALVLVFFPKLFQNKLVQALIKHKWSLLLMGFFSTYCGLIYNQYFSISLNLFKSCYNIGEIQATLNEQCVYPMGIDPIWSISQNQLQFTNSLKMKISVIIAVIHMTLGLVLKAINQIYSKKYLFALMETLPQLIFFILFFGYMDFLIIYKWIHQWIPQTAPSIITTMMNIPLQLGKTQNCCGGHPMWGDFQTTSQNGIQLFILIIILLCIPMILCLKPLYLYFKQKNKASSLQHEDLEYELKEMRQEQKMIIKDYLLEQEGDKEQNLPMGQIIVHQIILTIQFILGTISNTASYLRLWALSLAHASLSDVFFQQTIQQGLLFGYAGIPLNIVLFPIFAGITFGILLCMDTMQCFLHSLRLHWVQFQNKFYKGDGKQFQTLNFRDYTNNWLQINQID